MRTAVIFHRGALGDSVLTWPLLRALAGRHDEVALVTDLSKGKLAQKFADPRVLALDAERREFVGLWHGGAAGVTPVEADLVIHLCATPVDDAGKDALDSWERGAKTLYPGARIVMGAGMLDRPRALELAKAYGRIRDVAPLHNPTGTIVIHVGAGSAEKRWPLPMWRSVVQALSEALPGHPVRIIAGEVEAERFTQPEREMFLAMGGTYLAGLDELAQVLQLARGFIGVDSGPSHVAAAMGVPTLALFGPTEPERWGPIGPLVQVVAPPAPRGMAWLRPDQVVQQAREWLAGSGGKP